VPPTSNTRHISASATFIQTPGLVRASHVGQFREHGRADGILQRESAFSPHAGSCVCRGTLQVIAASAVVDYAVAGSI
jgi:hypothetical protein